MSAVVFTFTKRDRVLFGTFVGAWKDFAGVVYTRPDHSVYAHSFVAVVPYVRLVSVKEHMLCVERLADLARSEGRPFDAMARNPARFIHLPGTIPGQPFSTRMLPGGAIDPASLLLRSVQ